MKSFKNHIEEVELDEAAPKMKGDWLKKEREKNRAHDAAMGRTPTGRKKPVRQMTSTQRSLAKIRGEEVELDEVLDTPKAMDSYKAKAKYSKDRAANSAAAKILRGKDKDGKRADHSPELKTMAKREKGMKMADKNAIKKTFKKLRGEETELDEAKTGMFGGKYTSKDHMIGMKNFSKIRDKRAAQRNAEHEKQDPKMAKMGYAKHMLDTDKADAKARKRGIDPTGKYDKYKKKNGIREEVEITEADIAEILRQYALSENVNADQLAELTEEEINEIIGKAVGGAFKLGAKAVVGAARMAKKAVVNKQGNIRGTKAARQDAAGNRAEKEARKKEAEYKRKKRISDMKKRASDLDKKISDLSSNKPATA
jgi:hypothetical protein